jgi:lysophospholipase L1-like esterase
VTTTAAHTRVTSASPPKPDAMTVALVGGSTTFGTKLTDSDTWPWQLQTKLGDAYQVLNFGVPGYTTAEAIIQMALIVPEHSPRVVVFYEGWNDLRNYHWPHVSADYYGHGMTQFDTLLPPIDRTTFWDRSARNSFVVGLLNRALGTSVGAQTLISDRNDPEVDRIYRRNLHTLRALARRFDMTALFVPQVINDSNYSKKGVSRSWTPHIEDAAVPRLLKDFNQIMAGVCAPADTQCEFVGEVLNVVWDGNDFVDEGHLSGKGGEKLASIVEARIRRFAPPPP